MHRGHPHVLFILPKTSLTVLPGDQHAPGSFLASFPALHPRAERGLCPESSSTGHGAQPEVGWEPLGLLGLGVRLRAPWEHLSEQPMVVVSPAHAIHRPLCLPSPPEPREAVDFALPLLPLLLP